MGYLGLSQQKVGKKIALGFTAVNKATFFERRIKCVCPVTVIFKILIKHKVVFTFWFCTSCAHKNDVKI